MSTSLFGTYKSRQLDSLVKQCTALLLQVLEFLNRVTSGSVSKHKCMSFFAILCHELKHGFLWLLGRCYCELFTQNNKHCMRLWVGRYKSMQSLAFSSNNFPVSFFETQQKSRDERFVNITRKSKELFILEAEFPGFFQQ